jgi:hypothetical protein
VAFSHVRDVRGLAVHFHASVAMLAIGGNGIQRAMLAEQLSVFAYETALLRSCQTCAPLLLEVGNQMCSAVILRSSSAGSRETTISSIRP